MDFTHFIANQETIEPALKSGLYIVQQSHLPLNLQAFRCGLAGKPSDAAKRAFQGKQSSFSFAVQVNVVHREYGVQNAWRWLRWQQSRWS